MATVVNKHTHTLAPGDVYIGRGSRWGNPFSHTPYAGTTLVASREEAVAEYRRYLWHQINAGEVSLEDLADLDGRTLVCFCKPKACHGDVLASAAAWACDQIGGAYYTPRKGYNCPTCGSDPCFLQCPENPHYLTPEREKEDALYEDSLSQSAWYSEAVKQYERVHGEPYVS